MPSHPKGKVGKPTLQKRAGGPLKRKDEKWDSVIGPSINTIPGAQLPKVRTVIQRYRGLRIDNPTMCSADAENLIATEVMAIWQKAGIPPVAMKNCKRKIEHIINQWKSCHNAKQAGDKMTEKLKGQLNCLVDLAPKKPGKLSEETQHKYLKEIMRKQSHREKGSHLQKRNWEQDFCFYVDQKV